MLAAHTLAEKESFVLLFTYAAAVYTPCQRLSTGELAIRWGEGREGTSAKENVFLKLGFYTIECFLADASCFNILKYHKALELRPRSTRGPFITRWRVSHQVQTAPVCEHTQCQGPPALLLRRKPWSGESPTGCQTPTGLQKAQRSAAASSCQSTDSHPTDRGHVQLVSWALLPTATPTLTPAAGPRVQPIPEPRSTPSHQKGET